MKTITLSLDQFPRGYYLAWTVASQCYNTINVKIIAGERVYFNKNKTNHDTKLQIFAQDSAIYQGEPNLRLVITVNEATKELQSSISSGAITNRTAKRVGYVYDFCIEDDIDEDFNDVYINIVGWERSG